MAVDFNFNLSCSIKNHIENKHKHICGPMDFDVSWCKQNNIADYYIEHNNYYQALYELSMCSSVIMSNSTFSWWGHI